MKAKPAQYNEDRHLGQTPDCAEDLSAMATAQLRTFAAPGKHLQALSDQVGGGVEPVWYARLYSKLTSDLQQFM